MPIACNLSRLTDAQRQREQALLGKFRTRLVKEAETEDGFRFSVPAEAAELADLGEFLGLERLCCPFLVFRLEVTQEETARLSISGPEGVKDFILQEFTR